MTSKMSFSSVQNHAPISSMRNCEFLSSSSRMRNFALSFAFLSPAASAGFSPSIPAHDRGFRRPERIRGRWKRGSGNTGQTLPTTSAEADTAVRNSRYAVLDDSEFYRGLADAGGDGSALVFASNAQLELLQSATQIYFDATFKVLPTVYYQLFTVFADSAFPVFYEFVVCPYTLPTKSSI